MPQHPYYPPTLHLPTYTPPTHTYLSLLLIFGLATLFIILTSWTLMTRLNPALSTRSKTIATWFLYCGLLHIHFEGYFVKYRATLPARTDLLASLWKEYALSDSRYMLGGQTADGEFMLGIEAFTVIFIGPMCLLTFLAVVFGSSKQHVMKLLTCCCHVYGVILYFVTSRVGGDRFCRPESWYYWVYYVGFNAPWFVVPVVIAWESARVVGEAVEFRERRRGRRED